MYSSYMLGEVVPLPKRRATLLALERPRSHVHRVLVLLETAAVFERGRASLVET